MPVRTATLLLLSIVAATASSASVRDVDSSSNNNIEGHPAFPRCRKLVAKKTQPPTGEGGTFSYDPVTIVNYTPIETLEIHVAYSVCHDDYSYEPLAPGDRWHGPNRGLCLINRVDISLNRSNPPYTYLACTPYKSTGTRYSFFNLEMRPDGDTCCVRSSHEEEYGGYHDGDDTADDGKPLI